MCLPDLTVLASLSFTMGFFSSDSDLMPVLLVTSASTSGSVCPEPETRGEPREEHLSSWSSVAEMSKYCNHYFVMSYRVL